MTGIQFSIHTVIALFNSLQYGYTFVAPTLLLLQTEQG